MAFIGNWAPELNSISIFMSLKTQTSRVTGWQVSFENRYAFSFFHMPNESILVLYFINRIGGHFRTLRSHFGPNEKKLLTVQSLDHNCAKLIPGIRPPSPCDTRGARYTDKIRAGSRRGFLTA